MRNSAAACLRSLSGLGSKAKSHTCGLILESVYAQLELRTEEGPRSQLMRCGNGATRNYLGYATKTVDTPIKDGPRS